MLYSEIKERENRFKLSLKISLPFIFIIIFVFLIITTNIDIKELLKNNVIAFLSIIFIYIYYILYQIYMAFNTTVIDSVTKAFSKDYMLKIIDKKRDIGEKFFVIGLKIKNIEDINERYGIKKTDNLLNLFVNELNQFLTKNGFKKIYIGYIVGGNFLFILDVEEKKLSHILRQFIHKIENSHLEDIYLKIVHAYKSSDMEDSAEELMVAIFEELKVSKLENRKNRRLDIKVNEFEKLIVELIDNREFDFRFQPVKNLETNLIDTYEILTRLKSKKYGKISQNQYISIVNRVGYELVYDMILIEEMFKIVSKIDRNLNFSIGISANSINSNKFLHHIKKLLKIYKIDTKYIIFEINGESYINDIYRLDENIKILKNMGFKIAIENFGGSDITFTYIKYLNIDIVKFDIEYSKKYNKKRYYKIILAFVEIFKKLDIKSEIKFIENKESYKFFEDIGVNYIQGFMVGKPISFLNLNKVLL